MKVSEEFLVLCYVALGASGHDRGNIQQVGGCECRVGAGYRGFDWEGESSCEPAREDG